MREVTVTIPCFDASAMGFAFESRKFIEKRCLLCCVRMFLYTFDPWFDVDESLMCQIVFSGLINKSLVLDV